MYTDLRAFKMRLRLAASLQLCLPGIVAAACLAHARGSLGDLALWAVLITAIAAGVFGAWEVLRPARRHAAIPPAEPIFRSRYRYTVRSLS